MLSDISDLVHCREHDIMYEGRIELIKQYLEKVKKTDNRAQLKAINEEFSELFTVKSGSEDVDYISDRLYAMISELVILREERRKKTTVNSTDFTEAEHAEIFKVQKLIDYNLFTYHFQPIVRADNGEIYSYEALMRAKDMQGITPFHILKYAEITDRLDEVEQYTFLNVLNYIKNNKAPFEGKLVFINSMPSVHIDPMKESEITGLLGMLSDKIVVEMTEDSEFNDDELNSIKEKYRGLNIRIAIDDYGTGYSNISNLLRYTPNYVKIDRSLLSGIENNPNKKHFVREIIDFCHGNGILALAEGVENSEELRTVILLGADLIQGFYLARPNAEVIQSIPYELREEIRSHRQEREDGKRLKIYTAGENEHISLDRLCRDGYNAVRIPGNDDVGNVTLSGSTYLETDIHIETAEGFRGRITLDSARLSNLPGRPCINIGENSDASVRLVGHNRFDSCGIKVPESSRLTLEGDGTIDIVLSGTDYYGIGNDLQSKHGELVFDQDGTVAITAESHTGVCIGSGLGGRINAKRGRYVLKSLGAMGVCMGAFDGGTEIRLIGCDMDTAASGAHCTAIGSLNGNADVEAMYSSIKCKIGSIKSSAVGTALGEHASVKIDSAGVVIEINADSACALGSYDHHSDINVSRSSLVIRGDGKNVLAFGGTYGITRFSLKDLDMTVDLSTEINKCYIATEDNINVVGGRFRIRLNNVEYNAL